MPDLTNDELDELRTVYLRDKYVASPLVTYSHYNRAVKANFFSDDDLQLLNSRVETDFAEELGGVYDEKHDERILAGDNESAAATAAAAERNQAKFRVIRAEARQMMMEDPGFVGSIADEKNRAALFASWRDAITRDRTFARVRSTGPFASIPLQRF